MAEKLLKEIESGSKNAQTKKKIVAHFIYNGSATINDLSKELDLSIPTVNKFLGEMVSDGYVQESGKLETTSGRRPSVYELSSTSGYFVGVDIKKFTINIGIINFKGEMVSMDTNIPYKFDNTREALDRLCSLISAYIEKSGIVTSKVMNVCITISGRVNPESGYSFSIFNFSEKPLAQTISEMIGYPVCIDNDTRIMTYGEYLQGGLNGEKNMIFVNVSWGIGIGLIIDGKIYTGKSGFAGEFGHVSTFDNEILCHCGKKGCLETEISGNALHRILTERVKNGEASLLSPRINDEENPLTLDEIISAIHKEDPLCIEIVEEIGQKLGKQIAGLINIFNPELIVIGGALAMTGEYLIAPLRTAVRKYSLNLVNRDSMIMPSRLMDKAGVIGACMLARSRMFEIN